MRGKQNKTVCGNRDQSRKNGGQTESLLGFLKAFDIMLHIKLEHYLKKKAAVTGKVLQQLRGYLSNRKQNHIVGELSQ